MKKIVIIDYGLGNLFSVKQALIRLGITPVISNKKDDIKSADGLILPGVGAFNQAMSNMNEFDIANEIVNQVNKGTPLFGICLGLQLLFKSSEEFGQCEGLGLLEGSVVKFRSISNQRIRIPQINWNFVEIVNPEQNMFSPLSHIGKGDYFYFVHSYYVKPDDYSISLSITEYSGIKYTSSIIKDNIFACQFHPEKSGEKGVYVYKNWLTNNNLL